jgi:hypothetical protein
MDAREERGLQIAKSGKIVKIPVGWKVPSQSGVGSYVVTIGEHPYCTCPDFESRQQPCKHIHAVEFVTERKTMPDGTETVTRSMKVTCTQEWPKYNEAQTHEQERFIELLRDLCNGIQQPEYHFGRPRLPLSDVVFGLVLKSYTTFSGRRLATALRDAQFNGIISRAAHYNSSFNYLENPQLTPLLKTLIEQSASPLKAVESDFAVDSSGFTTSTYTRWFDMKYGKERAMQGYIKAHVMCGVKTHIVTAVECGSKPTGDSTEFVPLVKKTAETFNIKEVSADKAYSSRAILHTMNDMGINSYIPFKANTQPTGGSTTPYDGLWHKMWLFYQFNQQEFFAHYH